MKSDKHLEPSDVNYKVKVAFCMSNSERGGGEVTKQKNPLYKF